jgi:hypothetical protein
MNRSYKALNAVSRLPQSLPARLIQCKQTRHFSTRKPLLQAQNRSPPRPDQVLNPFNRQGVQSSISNDYKRMRLLAVAAVTCMVTTYGVLQLSDLPTIEKPEDSKSSKPSSSLKADAPKNGQDKFQGKPIVVVGAGAKVVAHDENTGEDVELVPTGTSSIPHFPKTIQLPSADVADGKATSEYTLIGLGIRTVSFLGIQVYVMGLYVQTSSLAALQSKFIKKVNPQASSLIPGEKELLRNKLLDPEQSYQVWDEVLRESLGEVNSAFRIVPTRSTDFGHLRDGWVRGITARTQDAGRRGDMEFSDESFAIAMKSFNALLGGKGKAPKGSSVILTRDSSGKLGVIYEEKAKNPERFGKLSDERIGRLIWLNYLGGKNVSSEDARKRIVEGIVELVERPVGTVATMVT